MDRTSFLVQLNEIVRNASNNPNTAKFPDIDLDNQEPLLVELSENLRNLINSQYHAAKTIEAISDGSIKAEYNISEDKYNPIRNLQLKLKHLIWQTERIAEGDYSQRIDFLGDFSNSFNQLIQSLKKQREIEEALHKSEARYKLIAENTNDVIFVIDLKTLKFNYVSPSIEKQRGYTVEEAMHQDLKEALTPESYIEANKQMEITLGALEKKQLHHIDHNIYSQPCKDGRIIDVEISTSFVFNKEGIPVELVGISRDITERHRAELMLKESEEKFRIITENATDIICKVEFEHLNVTYVSPSIEKILGYQVNEVIGNSVTNFLTEASNNQMRNLVHDLSARKDPYRSHIRTLLIKKDGTLVNCEFAVSLLKNNSGQLIEGVAIIRDIEQRIQIENKLKSSQKRLESLLQKQTQENQQLSDRFQYLFHNSNNGIAIFTKQNGVYFFESCNQPWRRYMEGNTDLLEGRSIKEVCTPEIFKIYTYFLDKAFEKKEQIQEYMQWRDFHFHIILNPIINETSGEIDTCIAFVYNVTDKTKAEQRALEYNERFVQLFSQSNEGILLLDQHLKPVEINPRFFNIIQSNSINLNNDFINEFVEKKDKDRIKNKFKKLLSNEEVELFECKLQNSEGTVFTVEMNITNLNLQNRQLIICIIRDITARKELERMLNNVSIQVENRERKHIANDLHDNVGPLLSSMNMYLSILSRKEEVKPHKEILSNTQHILKETISSVREISNNLNPQVLQRFGLSEALNTFFETKKDFINLSIENNLESFRFSEEKETMVYNIIKEAYNNSLKHSNASQIKVLLHKSKSTIVINYQDNGVGFNLQEKLDNPGNTLGLQSIISRIKHIEGKYKVISSPGEGFKLSFSFSV